MVNKHRIVRMHLYMLPCYYVSSKIKYLLFYSLEIFQMVFSHLFSKNV